MNRPAAPTTGSDAGPDLDGLAILFAELGDAVVVADRDRRITWINRAAEEAFGYALPELVGRKTLELYASAADYARQGRTHYNRRSRASGSRYMVEYRRRSGATFLGETSGTCVRDAQGGVAGYFGIIRDVSQDAALGGALHDLHEVTSNHASSGQEKIEAILELGCAAFGLPTGIVGMAEGDALVVLYARSHRCAMPEGARLELSRTPCARTLARGGLTSFHEAPGGAGSLPQGGDAPEAYIGLPLAVDGEAFGTLAFAGPDPRRPFDEAERELMRLYAASITQELSLARAMERLTALARTDALTGCLTRGAFTPLLEEAAARGRDACLILFDLDRFKVVNDTHGHAAGDEALRVVGALARKLGRQDDAIARLGGEEFALLCPDAGPVRGMAIAERLRRTIAAAPIRAGAHRLPVTASFGVAPLAPGFDGAGAWMEAADRALYEAKRSGRDRCVLGSGAALPGRREG